MALQSHIVQLPEGYPFCWHMMRKLKFDLLARYEDKSYIRGLIQLIPIGLGAAIETTYLVQLNRYRTEQLQIFFDELGSGNIPLTEELIQSNDFLHCYFATLRAVLRSRRDEKIKFLARLLRGCFDGKISDIDEYEELVGITDELSHRELMILAILNKHEMANEIQESENRLHRAERIWPNFVDEVKSKTELDESILSAILVRIQRSGCYEEFTGSFLNYTGGKGQTTDLYRRLAVAAGNGSYT